METESGHSGIPVCVVVNVITDDYPKNVEFFSQC